MASLINGLSTMGAGIASFAGTAGLEQQKSDLQQQTAILADQLATTRETAGRQQAGDIATTAATAEHGFLAGQQATQIAGQAANTATVEAGAMARTQATINAEPPEIRAARDFAKMSPEEQHAFTTMAMTKAGLPAWMTGGDNPPTPANAGAGTPLAGPRATAPSDSAITGTPATDASGSAPPVPGSPAVPVAPDPGAPNRNTDALARVPPAAASVIKGMVDGRISPPSSMAMSKPYWQGMIAKAAEYDPAFDQTTWAGRVATRKSFTAGQDATALAAINTALSHAGGLDANFTKLNNFGGIATPLNAPVNAVEGYFGDARQTMTLQNIDSLASEARKVFAASGGGNLTELENWQKNFPMNGSPSQQHGALTQFVDLLDGRLSALGDKYNRGMGRADDPMNMLDPKPRAIYQRLTGRDPDTTVGSQMGNSGGAAPATVPAATPAAKIAPAPVDIGQRTAGQSYALPNGKTGVWRGTGWELAP